MVFGFCGREAQAARGRPQLNAEKTTFVADNGSLLRGMICGSNPSVIPQTTNYGCNAVHLYAESANQGYNAGAKSNFVDSVVAMTRTNNMYLIITIGSGGVTYSNFIYDFWNFYSKRYANETHVLFEIQNEISSGGPSSAAVISVETNAYFIIRSNAPYTPVMFFSYVALNSSSGVLQDLAALGPGIDWSNAALAFHGYGSSITGMQTVLQNVLNAGYPCFQTEFYRWPWGRGDFPLGADVSMYQDTTETGIFERKGISWLTFMTIGSFTNNIRFKTPLANAGVLWTPDFGAWPSGSRGTYGNGGNPWFTTNLSSTIRIQAENYDTGGQGIAYNDTASGNNGALYRSDDVDIESTPDTGGGYDVGWIVAGEWLEYTTWIYEAGYYNIKLRVASPQPTNQISVSFYSQTVTNSTGTITFAGTGGNQTWTTITNTVFLTPGQQILHVAAITSGFNLNWMELSATASGYLTNGSYKIINRNSGLALEIAGAATTNGANFDQSTYTGASHQRWNFIHQGGDQYLVTNMLVPKALDADSYTSWSGDYVHTYTSANSLNQRYIFIPTDSDYYKILNVNSGLALQIAGAATTNGAILVQGEYTNSFSQQWYVIATNMAVPPPVPSGLNATPSSDSTISLVWASTAGVTGYNVKRADVSGGPYSILGTNVATTYYVDTGLSNNRDYYYVVSAVNVNSESADSSEVSATTLANGTIIVDDANPTGVIVTGDWTTSTSVASYYGVDYLHDGNTGGAGGKSVRFSPVLPATASYQVYLNWTTGTTRANNAPVDVNYAGGSTTLSVNQRTGGAWQLLGTFNFNAGTNGNVLIRNDGANGYVIADAVKFVQLPPSQPNGLTATPGDRQVALNWTGVSGATSYNVKRATVSGGTYANIASPVAASYTDTNVINGTNYYYVVSALGASVEGINSAEVSATPTSLLPVLLATTIDGNQLIMAWPSDHIGWHLQVQTNSSTNGLGTNWVDIANTTTGNRFTNQINSTEGSVFYRLKYP